MLRRASKGDVHRQSEVAVSRIPHFYWFKARADVEFARIRDCYLVTDDAVAAKCTAWAEQADAVCAELGDDAAVEAYLDEHSHIYDALSEHYPSMIRQAMFVSAYGRLEHLLNELCQQLQEERRLPIGLKDLKGAGLQRAKDYLKKVCGIAFPDEGTAWATIMGLAEIRNVIAHREGALKKSDKKAWTYLEKHQSQVTLDVTHGLIFSDEFVPAVLDVFVSFLEQVYAVLPDDSAERN